MASGSIGSCEHLVQQVLRYVPVRDLFSCSEVNDLWHRLSLALLRIKLKWVLCVAVTTAALLARMKRRSLECILSLRDAFKNVSNTIVVVFQREPMDTFVMQHIRCVFSDVAVVSMSGEVVDEVRSIASDGTSTPSDHERVAIMVLRLLPAHTDKKANKNKSKFRTPASV